MSFGIWGCVFRGALLLSLCLGTIFQLPGHASPYQYKDDGAQGLSEGAGIWINLWNYPGGDLDSYFKVLRQHGVRNVFLQTSRSNTEAIVNPTKLGEILEAAHRHKVRILAWSFAELYDPVSDADKMVAAAQYRSPAGEQVDGAAPNLEKNLEPWRIEKYAKEVRAKLGPNYPLIAVVYSPLNKCFEVKRISWPLLAREFDVIAPMIYWNSKYEKIEPYSYTVKSIKKIRELAGKPDLEISAIGDGMGSNSQAIHEFLRACHDAEATGISLYPNQKITEEQLLAVAKHPHFLKSNSRFRLAAFRDYVSQGKLNPPPGHDPSQAVNRREFYQLLVRQLYPAFSQSSEKGAAATKNAQKAAGATLAAFPSVAECKEADGVQALQILVNLGLVADMSELSSIQGILDSPIYPEEALSLVASVLDLDKQKLAVESARKRRLDRWLVPAAQAAQVSTIDVESSVPGGSKAADGKPLNYLDAAQVVHQASSAIR